jgi:large subunit ribosomal protein L6
MSRVAKKIIDIPQGVTATVANQLVTVKGAKGSLSLPLKTGVSIEQKDKSLQVSFANELSRPQAGATRAHIANMILGVTKGYEKKLELQGVGYRAALQGADLRLDVGYSHPVVLKARQGITFEVPTQTEIVVKGVDKQQVGQTAAEVRKVRPPEPYKGKGIRYTGEYVRRKVGKRA